LTHNPAFRRRKRGPKQIERGFCPIEGKTVDAQSDYAQSFSRLPKLMPRPRQVPKRAPLSPAEIAAASYIGSKEHKATKWWGGLPGARIGKDGRARRPKKLRTSICWLVDEIDRERASGWVRYALGDGQFRYYEGDKRYPKHIWHKSDDGQFWFGFLVNATTGTYKGWPIDESEKIETFG
jgi:hypothetical protein